MIKVFRPFWSYDVIKTEKWLSSMAEKGYHFIKLNRCTRCFFFQEGESKHTTYHIGFDKLQSLSNSIFIEGWKKEWHSGKWYVLSHEKPYDQIKITPVRKGIIKHNRIIMFIYVAIFAYLTFIGVFNLSILALMTLTNSKVEVVDSPMWIVTYCAGAIALAVYIFSIYSIFKIVRSNKYLTNENLFTVAQTELFFEKRLSKVKEKQLRHSGDLVIKRKFGWMYAPDKLEKWLESMEKLGFNLYRVNKTGTAFHFIKGSPRKISYCADYQNIVNESFFQFLIETGWKCVFSSYSSFQKWTIWSCEYTEDEKRPEIYSEKSQQLQHARRVAIVYTIMFLPVVIMYILNISLYFRQFSNNPMKLSTVTMILFAISILIFGSIIVRIWLYYKRLRKRYS